MKEDIKDDLWKVILEYWAFHGIVMTVIGIVIRECAK